MRTDVCCTADAQSSAAATMALAATGGHLVYKHRKACYSPTSAIKRTIVSVLVRYASLEALPVVAVPGEVRSPEQYSRLQEHAAFFVNAYPAWIRQNRQHRPLINAATGVM